MDGEHRLPGFPFTSKREFFSVYRIGAGSNVAHKSEVGLAARPELQQEAARPIRIRALNARIAKKIAPRNGDLFIRFSRSLL